MTQFTDIPFSLDAESLMHELRIKPGSANAETFTRLLAEVVRVGRPKALYEVAYIEERTEDSVVLGGVRFTSRVLRRNLDPVERVFPFVVTCGTEADAVAGADGDFAQSFWLWTIREALLHAAEDWFYDELGARYRMTHWATMSPGSGDIDVWPIEQQKPLFSLLGDVESLIGVRLTDAMLMIPTMSVSGILYASEADFESCQVCHREGCPRRKAPFDEALWRATRGD
jgi:hypothetical protein